METTHRNGCNQGLRTFISFYSLFKSEQLNTNIKLTLHKALIMSIMIYACPIWKFVSDIHVMIDSGGNQEEIEFW
jgi:Tfp pilus assembly ATPase PilU